MKNSIEKIRIGLHGFSFADTVFISAPTFLDSEVNIFSKDDRKRIWVPDGIPFLGEFDLYLKVYRKYLFQGFFRLEIYPWNEINLHIAFPTSNSFKSRYYLRATSHFLSLLNELEPYYDICCLVDPQNRNVTKYMKFFGFQAIAQENSLIRFKFRQIQPPEF
jgi:hypothetical protein